MKINKVYNYDGPLGNFYTKEYTEFKVWSPSSSLIKINIISVDNQELAFDMELKDRGVWFIKIDGNLEGVRYNYTVYHNDSMSNTLDPYAIASSENASYNVVINKDKLYHFKYDKPSFSNDITDAIIYETHIRDFTINKESNIVNKGKYLALTEFNTKTISDNPTGIDYLKYLGITHLQILPIIDFGGVDELDENKLYNWGYNPEQYFIPEGWYSINPKDPYSRINEFKEMIDILHQNNIRVVMDVVYNHVYKKEIFPFEKLVPNYYYQYDKQDNFTSYSGCGNDLDSTKYMTRKFIIDNVLYWAKEFNIDGFRFDLMGLIDIDTINLIKEELFKIDESILIYGEGWNMPSNLKDNQKASINNSDKLLKVSFFNDKFRDLLKGSSHDILNVGYFTGNYNLFEDIKNLLSGSCLNNYMFFDSYQSINYTECHDDYTVYDKLFNIYKDEYITKKISRLILSVTILAQGVPFIHSGQEFYRSKAMNKNSYNLSDDINSIKWNQLDSNIEDVNYIKKLINIRKSNIPFRQKHKNDILLNVEIKELTKGIIEYKLFNKSEVFVIYFNSLNTDYLVNFNEDFETVFIDGIIEKNYIDKLRLNPYSTNIIKK